MTVKVNDRHGTVGTVDRAQQGQGDSVVATQSDDTRQGALVLRRSLLRRICGRLA